MTVKKGPTSPTSQLCSLPAAPHTRDRKGTGSVILDPITHFEIIKRREREKNEGKLVKRLFVESTVLPLSQSGGKGSSPAHTQCGNPQGILNYVPGRWDSGRSDSSLRKA